MPRSSRRTHSVPVRGALPAEVIWARVYKMQLASHGMGGAAAAEEPAALSSSSTSPWSLFGTGLVLGALLRYAVPALVRRRTRGR